MQRAVLRDDTRWRRRFRPSTRQPTGELGIAGAAAAGAADVPFGTIAQFGAGPTGAGKGTPDAQAAPAGRLRAVAAEGAAACREAGTAGSRGPTGMDAGGVPADLLFATVAVASTPPGA